MTKLCLSSVILLMCLLLTATTLQAQTTRPGRLSDVFGIRIASFEETEVMNELSPKAYKGKRIGLAYKGKEINTESARFDAIELQGAQVLASVTSLDRDYPVITSHKYGKGTAIYVGLPTKGEVLNPIVDELITELSIPKDPVPAGVMARNIDKKHVLYFNTTSKPQTVSIKGKAKSVLFDKEYTSTFTIPAYEPEFIEMK